MPTRIVLIFALAGAVACDRQSQTPNAKQPTENSSSTPGGATNAAEAGQPAAAVPADALPKVQVPDTPPAELETREMPVGQPLKFEQVDSELKPFMRAAEGDSICVDRVFSDENRFVAGSREDCFKREQDSWWTLFGTDVAEPLATFTSVIEYGDEFDAIRVSKIIEDGQPVFGPEEGTPPYYSKVIGLKDGQKYTSDERMYARLHFVEGKRAMLVSTTERDPFRLGIAVVDEIPTGPIDTVETELIPTGDYRWDEKRQRIAFTANDGCRLGTVKPDGTDPKCRLRLPRKYFNGRSNWMHADWFVAEGDGVEAAIALNVESGEQVEPSEGTCGQPFYPHLDSDMSVPRLLIACTGEGRRKYEPTRVWLWTPSKRYELAGAPWGPDRSFGDYVSFKKGHSLRGAPEVKWLDLKRLTYWDPGALYLAAPGIATNAFPMSLPDVTEFYVIDDDFPALRLLGRVKCPHRVSIVHRDDDVVSVMCSSGAGEGCGVPNASIVDHSITWDLRTGKRHRTSGFLRGVTKDALLFSDVEFVKGGDRPCEPKDLAIVER